VTPVKRPRFSQPGEDKAVALAGHTGAAFRRRRIGVLRRENVPAEFLGVTPSLQAQGLCKMQPMFAGPPGQERRTAKRRKSVCPIDEIAGLIATHSAKGQISVGGRREPARILSHARSKQKRGR